MIQGFFMRFPNGCDKALTLSYDDGVRQDIRLIDIMSKNGLKGTFNLNSGRLSVNDVPGKSYLTNSEAAKLYTGSGNEVALHGMEHCFWSDVSAAAAMYDIAADKHNLEKLTGMPVRGGAYPFGTFNDAAVKILELSDIKYCRTIISSCSFDIPTDWLRLKPTCHHNDSRLSELTERFLNTSPDRIPYLFYLWGHSYEFDNDNNWELIEDFAEKVGGRDDIWYATNIEIYDYVQAFCSLIFASDGSFAINPTATDVWLYDYRCGKTIKIAANSRVAFE